MSRSAKEQLTEWERQGEYQRIIDAIDTVPEASRPLGMTVMQARSYFRLSDLTGRRECLNRAEAILESVREKGQNNPQWIVLMGHVMDRQGRMLESTESMMRAQDLAWAKLGGPSRDPYEDEEEQAVSGYIRSHFDVETRMDWRSMSGAAMGIWISPARNGRRFQSIISCGIGACRQPKIITDDTIRMEMIMTLPPDWKLDRRSLAQDRWNWPLRVLGDVYDGMISMRQVIPPGVVLEMGKLGPGVRFEAAMILPLTDWKEPKEPCLLPSGEEVVFHQVICLYPGEVEASDRIPTPEYMDRMIRAGATITNPTRPAVFS